MKTRISSGRAVAQYLAMLPASRTRALTRGLLWLAPAALLAAISVVIFTSLWLSAPALRNRLVDFSLTLISLPLPLIALMLFIVSLRWLILSMWPGPIGFFAYADRLEQRLGPFGSKTFDLAQLQIQYLFELDRDDRSAGGFEAYLPEEEQLSKYLPRMRHPKSDRPLHETILRFAAESQADAAAILRPAIEQWRKTKNSGT